MQYSLNNGIEISFKKASDDYPLPLAKAVTTVNGVAEDILELLFSKYSSVDTNFDELFNVCQTPVRSAAQCSGTNNVRIRHGQWPESSFT